MVTLPLGMDTRGVEVDEKVVRVGAVTDPCLEKVDVVVVVNPLQNFKVPFLDGRVQPKGVDTCSPVMGFPP